MKKWIVGLVLATSLCMGCALIPSGNQDKIDSLTKIVMSLQEDYVRLDGSIRSVVSKMMTGEIPIEEGSELLKTLQAEQEAISGKISQASSDIRDLQDSGASTWGIIGSVILNLGLGFLGVKYRGAAKIASTVANTVIEGVERAGDSAAKASVARVAKLSGTSPVVDAYVQNVVRKIELPKEE